MFNFQTLLMLSVQSKVSIAFLWYYIEESDQAGISSHSLMMSTKPKNAVNQPLAKQPPVWGLCFANGRAHFTYRPGRLNLPLSWLDRRLDTISDPCFPVAAAEQEISALHNRWTHLSLVGQTYMLLFVSSTLWTRWSFYKCLLKCNHFVRAEVQVLKYWLLMRHECWHFYDCSSL